MTSNCVKPGATHPAITINDNNRLTTCKTRDKRGHTCMESTVAHNTQLSSRLGYHTAAGQQYCKQAIGRSFGLTGNELHGLGI